eukprot:5736381-Amphidinium_carterae.1
MTKIDSNAFSKLKRDALADVLNVDGNELVPEKRIVHTRSDHIDVATMCALKGLAASTGDL